MRIFEEPDADDGVPPDGVLPDGVPAVDGSTAVDDGASSSAPPPPPPPGPMPPNHPPPQGDAVMPPPPGPMPPNHPPPQGDAVMPLGQDFLLFKGLPFFAGLCVFTASSNEVGTDDRCWHCSECAKDDFEPQAYASALYDDPLALLDFF